LENNNDFEKRPAPVFSKRLKAGKRRTYFFDVRTTKANDYYLTITESKKRFDEDGYDRHKIFIYKEDFNKFIEDLQESVNHIKTDLMPEYDFDTFSRNDDGSYKKPNDGVDGEKAKNANDAADEKATNWD